MERLVSLSFLVLLVLVGDVHTAGAAQSDPIGQMNVFSGSEPNHIPEHIDALSSDSTARAIALEALDGASLRELESLGIEDLQSHLKGLVQDGLLVEERGTYRLAIPTLVGERRERLRRVTADGAAKLIPSVESMIPPLRQRVGDRPDVLFHMLWSRVVDAEWWPLFRGQFSGQSSPPSLAWIIFPAHSYQVGTNFWTMPDQDELAVTWAYGRLDCLDPLQKHRLYLIGDPTAPRLSDSARTALLECGCIDTEANPRLFAYHYDDAVDSLCDSLGAEYVKATHDIYDFDSLSSEFGIPRDDFFVILMHETAYSVFEQLDRSGTLLFPPALRPGGDQKLCVQLASIRRLPEETPAGRP